MWTTPNAQWDKLWQKWNLETWVVYVIDISSITILLIFLLIFRLFTWYWCYVMLTFDAGRCELMSLHIIYIHVYSWLTRTSISIFCLLICTLSVGRRELKFTYFYYIYVYCGTMRTSNLIFFNMNALSWSMLPIDILVLFICTFSVGRRELQISKFYLYVRLPLGRRSLYHLMTYSIYVIAQFPWHYVAYHLACHTNLLLFLGSFTTDLNIISISGILKFW